MIKELDTQRALKAQKVATLTREAVVLSAVIKHLTTPEVVEHPIYQVRHELTKLSNSTPIKIRRSIVSIVGHQITVISDPTDDNPVAVALAQGLATHPLRHPDQPSDEFESDNESQGADSETTLSCPLACYHKN